VVSQNQGTTTLTAVSGSSNLNIANPVSTVTNPQVGQSYNLGAGITITQVSSTEFSWSGPHGNTGSVYISGSNYVVSTPNGTTTVATVPSDYQTSSATKHVMMREAPCWLLGLLLLVAVGGLVVAAAAAGGELGLNPLADAGFYAAYIGVMAANFDYQNAGC